MCGARGSPPYGRGRWWAIKVENFTFLFGDILFFVLFCSQNDLHPIGMNKTIPDIGLNIMKILKTTFALAACALLAGCLESRTMAGATDNIPAPPDYNDSTQWYVTDRKAPADIFYIISTETGDYTLADGTPFHHADTYNDSVRRPLYGEMLGVDTLLSGRLNFFSPYYRQCSLQTFTSDSLEAERMPVALDDVRRAFGHYLKHYNQGRPFILAGFSIGGRLVVELMKEMDDSTFGRMIAAYTIGIGIPEETLRPSNRFMGAKGAGDTGVTICYNSVRDTSCVMKGIGKSAFAINPVNWRTDDAKATLITEPTPLLPVDQQEKDTMTVCLDTDSRLLIVTGYSATDYVLPLIGCEGNYHTREIWLYRNQLRENMALRARKFLEK